MSTRARTFASLLLSLAALAGSGCEDETPVKKGPVTAAEPGEQAKIDQGKKLIKEANDALGDKKYDKARKLLAKAAQLNNESQRFEIEEAQEKLDKRQAKLWANEVDETLKSKECSGAFKQLAEPLKALADSEVFNRELRRMVGADALKCVHEMVDQKVLANAYAEARKVAQNPEFVLVLGPAVAKKLSTELETTVAESLRAQIDPDIKAHRWAQAVERIDAAVKKGDATEEQAEALLKAVREGVVPEIAALATHAVGQRDAPASLRQIDQLAKLVRWAIVDPGVAALEVGLAMPPDLVKKRGALAIWVEAQHLAMRALTKPEVHWAHGKIPVSPAAKADAPSKLDIPHGTKVWILGATKERALITTVDPGGAPLVQVLDKVAGWVATDRLAKENTAEWLVPDDQLKGERVWGPLRQPDGMWELGLVMEVSGKDISVQRLADGVNMKLTRQKLRSGRLTPGTRVITFCVAKDQPAQVVEVPPTGRSAKLKCDGGQEKEEDLASLRSKPEILPPTK
jgi:hypothetical protein